MINATPQPKTIAAGKKYRNAGTPMRNIRVLMTATMAPAMPPPPDIFDTLICGIEAPSLIQHLLTLNYHNAPRAARPPQFASGGPLGTSIGPRLAGYLYRL